MNMNEKYIVNVWEHLIYDVTLMISEAIKWNKTDNEMKTRYCINSLIKKEMILDDWKWISQTLWFAIVMDCNDETFCNNSKHCILSPMR